MHLQLRGWIGCWRLLVRWIRVAASLVCGRRPAGGLTGAPVPCGHRGPFEGAESASEPSELDIIETLVSDNDHQMLEPGPVELTERFRAQVPDVPAANLRTKGRRERYDLDSVRRLNPSVVHPAVASITAVTPRGTRLHRPGSRPSIKSGSNIARLESRMKRTHCGIVSPRRFCALLAFAVPLAYAPRLVAEETWMVTGSAAAPLFLNEPYETAYGMGFTGALGIYHSILPQLSLGARGGGGVMEEEDDINRTGGAGTLGFGTLTGAARVRPFASPYSDERSTGFWLEVAAGGGLLEDQVRAAIEPGLGWIFEVGSVGIGPFGRYIQIIETEDQFDGNDARLALLGVEAVLFDERDRPMQPAARTTPAHAPAQAARKPAPAPQEPRAPEPERMAEAPSERVLDIRVLFDYDKSELRPEGKESLREIASSFMEEGQSGRILRVQGYADQRGSARYNLHLGTERALAVRNHLISLGVPADQIRTEAYGEDWPAVPNANESSEFQQNRRATFVIVLGDPTVAERSLRPAPQIEADEGRPGMEEAQPVRGQE